MGPNFIDYKGRSAKGSKMKVYIEDTKITKHEKGIYEPFLLADVTYRRENWSSISKFDLHCSEDTFQIVNTTIYSEPMAKGEILDQFVPFQDGWFVFGPYVSGPEHGFYSHFAEQMCRIFFSIDQNIPIKKGNHDKGDYNH